MTSIRKTPFTTFACVQVQHRAHHLPFPFCHWDQFLLLLVLQSAPALLFRGCPGHPQAAAPPGVTDPFSSYCHHSNTLSWQQRRLLWLFQGTTDSSFWLSFGPWRVCSGWHRAPQPSPTEPLQSPCYQAWEFVPTHLDKKHLQAPGWLLGCPYGWEWSAECG